jgi:DNA-binding CsgD family transcriptional regulator
MRHVPRIESASEFHASVDLTRSPAEATEGGPQAQGKGESAIVPAVIMNAEGQLLGVSRAFSEAVGFERDSLIGSRHPFPWCPAAQASRCRKRFSLLASDGLGELGVTSMSWRCQVEGDQACMDGPICLAVSDANLLEESHEGTQESGIRARDLEAAVQRIALEVARLGKQTPSDPVQINHQACDGLELLSAREWEVLNPFIAGRRVASIAKLLCISPHTVRNHLQSIYRKVGVGSQSELIDKLRSPS